MKRDAQVRRAQQQRIVFRAQPRSAHRHAAQPQPRRPGLEGGAQGAAAGDEQQQAGQAAVRGRRLSLRARRCIVQLRTAQQHAQVLIRGPAGAAHLRGTRKRRAVRARVAGANGRSRWAALRTTSAGRSARSSAAARAPALRVKGVRSGEASAQAGERE